MDQNPVWCYWSFSSNFWKKEKKLNLIISNDCCNEFVFVFQKVESTITMCWIIDCGSAGDLHNCPTATSIISHPSHQTPRFTQNWFPNFSSSFKNFSFNSIHYFQTVPPAHLLPLTNIDCSKLIFLLKINLFAQN